MSYRTVGAGLKPRLTNIVLRSINQAGVSMTLVGGSDGARDSTPILAAGSDIYRKLW